MDDGQPTEVTSNDDALGGDLALEPEDAEQVTGGFSTTVNCSACGHNHYFRAPKCNTKCIVHPQAAPPGAY